MNTFTRRCTESLASDATITYYYHRIPEPFYYLQDPTAPPLQRHWFEPTEEELLETLRALARLDERLMNYIATRPRIISGTLFYDETLSDRTRRQLFADVILPELSRVCPPFLDQQEPQVRSHHQMIRERFTPFTLEERLLNDYAREMDHCQSPLLNLSKGPVSFLLDR